MKIIFCEKIEFCKWDEDMITTHYSYGQPYLFAVFGEYNKNGFFGKKCLVSPVYTIR